MAIFVVDSVINSYSTLVNELSFVHWLKRWSTFLSSLFITQNPSLVTIYFLMSFFRLRLAPAIYIMAGIFSLFLLTAARLSCHFVYNVWEREELKETKVKSKSKEIVRIKPRQIQSDIYRSALWTHCNYEYWILYEILFNSWYDTLSHMKCALLLQISQSTSHTLIRSQISLSVCTTNEKLFVYVIFLCGKFGPDYAQIHAIYTILTEP